MSWGDTPISAFASIFKSWAYNICKQNKIQEYKEHPNGEIFEGVWIKTNYFRANWI